MSYDDKYFLSVGRRVKHRYKHGKGGTRTCALCGCKRRRKPSGYEYRAQIFAIDLRGIKPDRPTGKYRAWSSMNPPCVMKEPSK
jgi:hypothetical protein